MIINSNNRFNFMFFSTRLFGDFNEKTRENKKKIQNKIHEV